MLERIRASIPALPPAEQRVARLLLTDPRSFATLPVSELADRSHVSKPTVVRFCRSVGYDGLADFKLKLAGSVNEGVPFVHRAVDEDDKPGDITVKVVDNAVAALLRFYQIPPSRLLLVHDELDLPPGVARFKQGGGHGGHNGLRDIIPALANQNGFHRLRVGIGHPGDAKQVSNYVLGKAPASEQDKIEAALDAAEVLSDDIISGKLAAVMNKLNGFKA